MKKKSLLKEKSLLGTLVVSFFILLLFWSTYFQIARIQEKRCYKRMEEGVNTVIEEVVSKLKRDSTVLNATADILGNSGISAVAFNTVLNATAERHGGYSGQFR